jgi:hypothetical protein
MTPPVAADTTSLTRHREMISPTRRAILSVLWRDPNKSALGGSTSETSSGVIIDRRKPGVLDS